MNTFCSQQGSQICNLVREAGDKGIVLPTADDQPLGQMAVTASECEISPHGHPGMKSRLLC